MFYTFWAMVLFLFLFSIIAYLLLPTFIKMWQKMLKSPPSERAKRAEYVRMITCYLLITYFLLTYYLLITYFFTYLLLDQDVPKLLQRCAHGASEASGVRSYYVLITYWLLIYYLACCLLDMCVILALSWRDVCMVVAWDSLAIWFALGGTVFEKLMFAYVFTSTYSYPNLSRCVQNCSNGSNGANEASGVRSSDLRITY